MSKKYQNLLSPIKVGNIVFKNRLTASRSSPRFIQGSESYPTEALITHFANKAKNGAAMVTCGGAGMPHGISDKVLASLSPESVPPGEYDMLCLPLLMYHGDAGPCRAILRPLK